MRVWLVAALVVIALWYGKHGADNPFAEKRVIIVEGDAGGYSVVCATGRDARAAGELRFPGARKHSPEGGVVFKEVHPFADSARASLVSFAGIDILVCDSAVFAERPEDVRSLFREKIELLIIPSASEQIILKARDRFRPRLLAIIPPCGISSAQNIICNTDANGKFKYEFAVKGDKVIRR